MTQRRRDERDHGWAWVVIIGLAISSFILGGFLKAFGIFFAAFAETFGASASSTSLIIGVRAAVFTIAAPISAVLTERYSVRVVLIASGLFSSTGCMVAAFAPNMEVVILSTGVILGLGMSSYFGPVQIAIGQYFNKRKTIAVSIAFCGMSLAQIVMSPVNIILLEEFGLRGTLILYSGFLLNIVVAAALVRPVPSLQFEVYETETLDLNKKKEISMLDLASTELWHSHEIVVKPVLVENDKIQENGDRNGHKVPTVSVENKSRLGGAEMELITNGTHSQKNNTADSKTLDDKLLKRNEGEKSSNPKTCCSKIIHTISQILDFSLFRNMKFTAYAVSQCLGIIAFGNIPVYLFPRAEDYHLGPKESALLLTIMGGTDLLSRLLQGIFGDIERIGPEVIYLGGLFCFALSALSFPFTTNFIEMAISSSFIGFFGSCLIVPHMSIIVNQVGLHNLSKAVGLTSFMAGIVNAIAPPVLGYIKDATTSYDNVFFACAGVLFVGVFLMAAELLLRRKRSRNRAPLETDTDGF